MVGQPFLLSICPIKSLLDMGLEQDQLEKGESNVASERCIMGDYRLSCKLSMVLRVSRKQER